MFSSVMGIFSLFLFFRFLLSSFSLPSFPNTSLSISTYTLSIGETMYFRFFLPEELYCRSVVVIARPYYGTPSLLLSTQTAFPNFDNYGWRQVLPSTPCSLHFCFFFRSFFFPSSLSFSFSLFFFLSLIMNLQGSHTISYGFGYTALTLCPVIHDQYTVGTYAGAVYALTSTQFYLEVIVSQDVRTDFPFRGV